MSRSTTQPEQEAPETHQNEWFGMFIPPAVWNHPDLNCVDKCLYAQMHAVGGWRGAFFASNAWIGKTVGVGENRASVIIAKLIRLNLVKVVKRDGRNRWIKTLFDRDDTKADFVKKQSQDLRKNNDSHCENSKIIGGDKCGEEVEEVATATPPIILSASNVFPSQPSPSSAPAEPPNSAPPPRKSKQELTDKARYFVQSFKALHQEMKRWEYVTINGLTKADRDAANGLAAIMELAEFESIVRGAWTSSGWQCRNHTSTLADFAKYLPNIRGELNDTKPKTNPNLNTQITERLSVPLLRMS